MTQVDRISGGLINRKETMNFSFNGKSLQGYKGDTLASALLANGIRLVGRSFKYHRPRGIFTSGSEEPNALVELRKGAFKEPNTRATVIELFNRLDAVSQNHKGPLNFDLMAATDLFLSPFVGAGFYYKTFMWPAAFWEKLYEPIIRKSAGLGSLAKLEDPDCYDKGFLHCDILIVGGGPAGLLAALAAGKSGAKVILADEDFLMGGRLNSELFEIDEMLGSDWALKAIQELSSLKNVRIMNRTTIYGSYDHGIFGALERCTDHLESSEGRPRQILWKIYSKKSILAAGAIERPIAFGNNDRPGIMTASSVRSYVNRWGVLPGRQTAIFTNNDDGWATAKVLADRGLEVAAVIDSRNCEPVENIPGTLVIMGSKIVNTTGRKRIKRIILSNGQSITCDCLAVSGGWSPNVHLTCHQGGRPKWDSTLNAFTPGENLPKNMVVSGSANGSFNLQAALRESLKVANIVLTDLDFKKSKIVVPSSSDDSYESSAFWYVKESKKRGWVDFQNDVTVKDIKQSFAEGFRSVEHMKRYTTMGMATDQGKTSNILGLAIMAECTGKTIQDTGTTIFRPPYTPIPLGALAGRSRGKDFRPYRLTPSHKWSEEQGAVFVEVGNWLRAQWFPKKGEKTWRETVDREVVSTRNSVGVCDVTTLGKIDIQGKDSADFLNIVYTNAFGKLPVGKVRYGLMLREDGIAYDDGTTARISKNHFIMTTTTANAVLVFRRLEFVRQCLCPDMDVHIISTTDAWAQFAVAGPNSRRLLEKVIDNEYDISNEKFPFMGCREITVCNGIQARLFRISFSGELAYELAIPTRYGDGLIRQLMEAGKEFDVTPYGTEALGVMRIEKGHAAGNELNGQTTALNLGLEKMINQNKDCIGKILAQRPEMNKEDEMRLVGFRPKNKGDKLVAGAHFLDKGAKEIIENDLGWMSSVCFSPILDDYIGLGFIKNGNQRMGDIVHAYDKMRHNSLDVKICSPHFVDPEGDRVRG